MKVRRGGVRMASGSERNLKEKQQKSQQWCNAVGALYRLYRTMTGGADGATGIGLNGSIRPAGIVEVLLRMGVEDKRLVDLGASDGRFARILTYRHPTPRRRHPVGFAGSCSQRCRPPPPTVWVLPESTARWPRFNYT